MMTHFGVVLIWSSEFRAGIFTRIGYTRSFSSQSGVAVFLDNQRTRLGGSARVRTRLYPKMAQNRTGMKAFVRDPLEVCSLEFLHDTVGYERLESSPLHPVVERDGHASLPPGRS